MDQTSNSIDLGGDGKLALVAIRRNLPYIGLCFTKTHVP